MSPCIYNFTGQCWTDAKNRTKGHHTHRRSVTEVTDLLLSNVTADLRAWWRHQMETFPALLTLCAGNSPVTGECPPPPPPPPHTHTHTHTQKPVTLRFDVFLDLRLNKRLSKQSRRRWFETAPAHHDVTVMENFIGFVSALQSFLHKRPQLVR